MAGSGTAYLCAGEGKGNEDLSGKECGIRGGGAVRGAKRRRERVWRAARRAAAESNADRSTLAGIAN